MQRVDTLIIGGGVTGLSLAAELEESHDYLLLEATGELGGYCKTLRRNGFVWDYSGHFFHFRDPATREWIMQHMQSDVVEVRKITDIYYNQQLVDFPFQYNIHQLPLPEFIQCLADLASCKEVDTTSFKSWIRSQLGNGICEKFLIPYNEKLYAIDLDRLDPTAMGRFFPKPIQLEELLQRISVGEGAASYNDYFIYPTGGAYEFIRSILHRVDETKIQLHTRVHHINPTECVAYTNQGAIQFNRLVSTMPFNRLLEVMCEPEEELSSNRVVVFNLGFDGPTGIQTHWRYFPDPEVLFYRVGFYNNIHQGDRMSLYVEIGIPPGGEVEEQPLLERTLQDLQRVGIIQGQGLVDHQYLLLDPAYVHITTSSERRVQRWQQRWNPKLYSIGRYGSWTYCSIEDNIIQARELAQQLAKG
jgi:protoporphyrinogen oxidase